MQQIISQLNQASEYIFHSVPGGESKSMKPTDFLKSHDHDGEECKLTMVLQERKNGVESVWSLSDGWALKPYKTLVERLIKLVHKEAEIPKEFIEFTHSSNLSPYDSASCYFADYSVNVEFMPHSEGSTGLLDFDISGIDSVRRVVFSSDIKKGDMFNIYFGESSKGGAFWNTDLLTTISDFFKQRGRG